MGVLGGNQTATHYFPNNSSNIKSGTLINWYLYLYNHMSVPKNIMIKVKLLNSTLPGPSDITDSASPIASFLSINQTLASNVTQILPFFFLINKATLSNNLLKITSIQVNNMIFPVNIQTINGQPIRLVFELWSSNIGSNNYVYSWVPNQGFNPVWNEIWFSVTP